MKLWYSCYQIEGFSFPSLRIRTRILKYKMERCTDLLQFLLGEDVNGIRVNCNYVTSILHKSCLVSNWEMWDTQMHFVTSEFQLEKTKHVAQLQVLAVATSRVMLPIKRSSCWKIIFMQFFPQYFISIYILFIQLYCSFMCVGITRTG